MIKKYEIKFFNSEGTECTSEEGYTASPFKSDDGIWCHYAEVEALEINFNKSIERIAKLEKQVEDTTN